MLAESEPGVRIPAMPGAQGTCPICHAEVIPKCGEIKTWHWAHKSLSECDTWYEPESDWHFGWKKLAGLENTEIVIKGPNGIHRADIKINGLVIELQHSPLSPKDVRERESFYGSMIWVIDGDSVGEFRVEQWISKNDTYYLKWEGKLKSWINEIQKTKFFHFRRLEIHTYYWQNAYRETDYYPYTTYNKMPVQPAPVKFWKPARLSAYPMVLEDILVKIDEKFCRIVSKPEFMRTYFGRTAAQKKQNSLFNF